MGTNESHKMPSYYEKKNIIIMLKELENPNNDNLNILIEVIKNDLKIIRDFYEDNDNEKWLPLLKEAGEFDSVPQAERDVDGGVRNRAWPQSRYLVNIADKVPEDVFEIIRDFDTDNIFVMRDCLQALGKMPGEAAVRGMELVRRLLSKDIYREWHFGGEEAAKLMVRWAEEGYLDQAFEVAVELLAVKIKEDKHFRSWHTLEGRYQEYEYQELVFTYFRRLWELEGQGLRAGGMLVGRLDGLIEKERERKKKEPIPPAMQEKYKEIFGEGEVEEEEELDPTVHSYIMMPSLEKLLEGNIRDIADVIVAAIGKIGRHIIEHDGEQSKELIDLLQGKKWMIFKRIELHLLRFVPVEDYWNGYISKVIGENMDNIYELKDEYETLLHEKWEAIGESGRNKYLEWVKNIKIHNEENYKNWIQEVNKRAATHQEIEAHKNYLRSQALYCIRDKDKVKDLFQTYLEASGSSEEDIKPKPRFESGWVAMPTTPEKSPLKPDEMRKMGPTEVIEQVKKCDETIPDGVAERLWDRDEKGALANAFKQDVIERAGEYLEVESDLILGMKSPYVSSFFEGIDNALNMKKLENPDWGKILEIAKYFVDEKGMEGEYRSASQVLPRILERGFKMESDKMPATEEILDAVWEILTGLLRYEEEEDISDDEDPLTGCINCVQGVALENTVRFGLFVKNENAELFASRYASQFRATLQRVLEHVDKVKIRRVFGVFFSTLCWMDQAWVKENLDRIFPEEDDRTWDAVWGSYVYWGRVTKQSYDAARNKYAFAMGRIGEEKRFDRGKEADKKLVDHLMTAYWHGWEGVESLLDELERKADDELRAGASRFLATGFKELRKYERDEWREGIEKRLLSYWGRRYAAMAQNPEEHQAEGQEFARWIEDSPFDRDTAFDIAAKAVKLTGGKVRRLSDFVNGVCELAEGREFKALKLIRNVMEDPDFGISFSLYKENLTELMNKIMEMSDEMPDVEKIRKLAIDIADNCGRLGIEQYKDHYDRLRNRVV